MTFDRCLIKDYLLTYLLMLAGSYCDTDSYGVACDSPVTLVRSAEATGRSKIPLYSKTLSSMIETFS